MSPAKAVGCELSSQADTLVKYSSFLTPSCLLPSLSYFHFKFYRSTFFDLLWEFFVFIPCSYYFFSLYALLTIFLSFSISYSSFISYNILIFFPPLLIFLNLSLILQLLLGVYCLCGFCSVLFHFVLSAPYNSIQT